MSTDNIEEDFIHVMEIDGIEQALSTKITPRHETIGLGAPQKSTEFCTTVTARSLPEEDESARAPVDIVVALDVSGSMTGRKLELCKETLSLLRELSSQDRFGLVTFGSQANLEIPTRKLTTTNKDYALAKIKGLRTSGMTNMSGGIGLAAKELQAVESPHEVRTIFLLTDGHANVGISDKIGIVGLTKGCLGGSEGKRPIAIHCFGYGADHDREMLREISQATEGGTYYFVEQDSDVSSAFGDALGGILSVVAQNVVISVKIPDKATKLGVSILHVKHDKATKQPDGSYQIEIGDFYAEESRDVIVETSLSHKDEATQVPHITATVSYLDTINKKLVTGELIMQSISRPDGNEVSAASVHVALQCIRIKTTEVISATEKLAESNQLDKARSNISEYINDLQQEAEQLGESGNPLILQLLTELNTIMSGLASRDQYESVGSKYMQTRFQTHQMQRCAEPMSEESTRIFSNVYRSNKKAFLATKLMKKK